MFLCVQMTEEAYVLLMEELNLPKLDSDPNRGAVAAAVQDLVDATLRPAIQKLLLLDITMEPPIIEQELHDNLSAINSSIDVSFLRLCCSIDFEMFIEIFTLLLYIAGFHHQRVFSGKRRFQGEQSFVP